MIIFLNGSINSGKSTVAKLLAQKLPKSALLEIDALSTMIEWMPLEERIPLNLENALSLIQNFAKAGLTVIVPYPLSQRNYDYLRERLEDLKAGMRVFTLAPNIENALSDTPDRTLTEWEKGRIKQHYDAGIPNPSFGEVIDTTQQAPEETVAEIMSALS